MMGEESEGVSEHANIKVTALFGPVARRYLFRPYCTGFRVGGVQSRCQTAVSSLVVAVRTCDHGASSLSATAGRALT